MPVRSGRSRRNHTSICAQISLVSEVMELRQVMSATSGSLIPSATKQITVTATYDLPHSGYSLEIDAVVVKGSTVHVFSTVHPPTGDGVWPQVITPAEKSLTVTVPSRDLAVEYHYGNSAYPDNRLYHLIHSDGAAVAYQNPTVGRLTAWPVNDVEESDQSPLKLDLRPGPAKPEGFLFEVNSETSEVTIYFDERPSFAVTPGNRHIREYSITYSHLLFPAGRTSASLTDSSALQVGHPTKLVMDEDFFEVTRLGQQARRFGGQIVTYGSVYASFAQFVQIKVRELPIFPDGATNTNALATDWSDSAVHKLPWVNSQDIIVVTNRLDLSLTVNRTVLWREVENAASYDLWIKSIKGDKTIVHRTSILGTELTLDTKLDPGEYRLWVRATRTDGSRTSWATATTSVSLPTISVSPMQPTGDKTPTIRWTGSDQAASIIVRVIDEAKEEQAKAIRFASEADRINFTTAYTVTLPGNSNEHELSTPIAAGEYRAVVIEKFANGETAFGRNEFVVEAGIIARPVLTRDWNTSDSLNTSESVIVANPESATDSYEIWVAYFGPSTTRSQPVSLDPQHGNWQFARINGSVSGQYRLPADAPAGRYQIWMRAADTVGGTTFKTAWSAPIEVLQSFSVWADGNTVRWNEFPGATGYGIRAYFTSDAGSVRSTTKMNIPPGTSWTLPESLDAGTYQVSVVPLGLRSYAQGTTMVNHHLESEWSWDVRYTSGELVWNRVPNAVRYQIELSSRYDFKSIDFSTETTETSLQLTDLTLRSVNVRIRALRTVEGTESWSLWERNSIAIGVDAPEMLTANGTKISWDSQGQDVTYDVTISMTFSAGYVPGLENLRPLRQITGWRANTIDLAEVVGGIFASSTTANFGISVRTVRNGNRSADSKIFVELPLYQNLQKPIVENVKLESLLPAPVISGGGSGQQLSIQHRTDRNPAEVQSPTSFVGLQRGISQRMIARLQLNVTNLYTGESFSIDDSDILFFVDSFRNWQETSSLSYDLPMSRAVREMLFGATGVYQVKTRVQYIPIILSAEQPADLKSYLSPFNQPVPGYNVSVTPWSEWSTPLEYTVLPQGAKVLPVPSTAESTNRRPEFVWGVEQGSDGAYELWVENAATKKLVIRDTYVQIITWPHSIGSRPYRVTSNVDLPPGTYHWWARKVGETGPRNGWSPKQTIEIVEAPLSVIVDKKTVDATPVISWQRTANAESYVIELRSVASGNVVYSATEPANTASHRVNTPQSNGDFHVIVRALLPNGVRTGAGRRDATGKLVPIVMTIGAQPENLVVSRNRLEWQAVSGATRYQVFVQSFTGDGAVQNIVDEYVVTNSFELPSTVTGRPGEYRFWIRAIRNEAGHESTGLWSNRYVYHVSASSVERGQDIEAELMNLVASLPVISSTR